ncbi:DNA/RNA non-specific endonuclease [Brevibacillus sp. GCM10020057]|uniref:DNA/RNA non-specific endonuclease n=1 Tax=Brevibacillus sp. GCM10020057 TaxID=3317327 RepID=UPI00362B8357
MQTGYDPFFLGERHPVPLPLPQGRVARDALNHGQVFDFTHFSIAMNRRTRFAIYSAACVDASRAVNVGRGNTSWHFDERIGAENQVGPEYYAENDFDRGHLTRRKDVCWGERREAEQANFDSFCYANIALQHHEFNTGIWNCLEDWVIERLHAAQRLIIFTGPIHKDDDEEYCGKRAEPGCGVRVPFGFWKSALYVSEQGRVACLSFLIRQSPERTRDQCEYRRLVTYQVPLETISREAGLAFAPSLYSRDPLMQKPRLLSAGQKRETAAGRPLPVWRAADIVWELP